MRNITKIALIASVSLVGLTFCPEKSFLLAQTNEMEELEKLDELKRKQQEDLKKKLDIFNNKSDSEKVAESNITTEENPSNFLLTLGMILGSSVVGIGGLFLIKSVAVKTLVSQEYKQKLAELAPHEQPWWNRPLVGENSLVDFIFSGKRANIPEDAVILHKNYLAELKSIAAIAKAQDLEKFNTQDFLFYLKIRSLMYKDEGKYQGLKDSADLLEVAIKSKDSFLMIDQTELGYRGGKQQEFYRSILNLLGQNLEKEEFKKQVAKQVEITLPEIKSKEGKNAIKNYQEHLEILSEHELGLKLLSLFKTYNLADFSVLNRVSEIMKTLEKAVLTDTKILIIPIMKNLDVFEKLGPIIGLPEKKIDPKTIANIIQYIALGDRHGNSYREYANLSKTLKDWKKAADAVTMVRDEYNGEEYKIPPDFTENLIGEEIFNKYKTYLE